VQPWRQSFGVSNRCRRVNAPLSAKAVFRYCDEQRFVLEQRSPINGDPLDLQDYPRRDEVRDGNRGAGGKIAVGK
jgi:hypothetical protein